MWVVETITAGEVASWELSKAVPRNLSGEPVEDGSLGDDRSVVGSAATFDTMLAFLKRRSDSVRVGQVEKAWKAAESGGSRSERTVRLRKRAALQQTAQPRQTGSARTPSKPSSPLTGVIVLLVLAAAAYFFATSL